MAAAEPAETEARAGRGRPRAGALDVLVGRRMRERRLALGLTMQEVAAALGVPYQQLHKYETGANRLSAGRLFLLAEALGVEVAHFFGEDGADGLRVDLALLQQPQHRLADRLDGGLHPVRGLGLVVVHYHLVLWCHKLAGMG